MENSKLNSKKSTTLNIRQRRIFSEEFKREKVKELTSNLYSVGSFCKLWGVNKQAVYNWIYKYSPDYKKGTTMVVQKESESFRTNELLVQVAELQRCLGKKQMQLDYLEKLVELASKEYNVDIKKNFNVRP